MKTKNCGYRNFLIRKEKDILELKDLINNYKPISQNDIAFLLEKLKKERKEDLERIFMKHIIGKVNLKKEQEDIPQSKKKEKLITLEKENYLVKIYKVSDFHFYHHKIRVNKYVLETKRAFKIPDSLLQNIQGFFSIKVNIDNSFYFENYGLTRLLKLVNDYCSSHLDAKCEEWFMNKINSIENIPKIYLELEDFVFNETNKIYELKDSAIKDCPLNKEMLRYDFRDYIKKIPNIPKIYKDSYIKEYSFSKQIDKFNEEYRMSLTNIIRKYVYYTEKDMEVIKWRKGYNHPILVHIIFMKDVDTYKVEEVDVPSFSYKQQINLDIKYAPKGALYEFDDEIIASIESSIELLKSDKFYNLLKINIQFIKEKKNIETFFDKPFWGCFSDDIYGEKDIDIKKRYRYKIYNPLLDIWDNHYLIGHPEVKESLYKLKEKSVNKIAYFKDPNYVHSQETSGEYIDCYLLANKKYIVLYALDNSKSTYIFYIKEGCIDKAMFLIWSYFSSYVYNKREGKSIQIENLFPYFGIKYYDNTGDPISRDKKGLYKFFLPTCF